MAQRIGIVTDSTADLPQDLAEEMNITVVPLNVHFGSETLTDGVEIKTAQFYRRFNSESVLPNTSQPSPGVFYEAYQKFIGKVDIILSIHISKKLSGTAQAAQIAADMVKEQVAITVIDSHLVSIGLELMVLEAANLVKKGAQLKDLLQRIASFPERSKTYFTVDTLEHLERTGRIGKAHAFIGQLLNIKPVLCLQEGMIVPVEKVRGGVDRVLARIIEIIENNVGNHMCTISIAYGDIPGGVDNLHRMVNDSILQCEKIYQTQVGPVIGTHAGPGVIGISYLLEG